MSTKTAYEADQIQALSGLSHVRARPLMYLGSAGVGVTGLHHLIWEIVDNSVDEAMAGHGNRIVATLHKDGSVSVTDNGRGVPIGPMKDGPHKGRSALEVVLCETNAGGKFDSDSYKVSGGLHGVGASVVTALSSKIVAEVRRDGQVHRLVLEAQKVGKGKAATIEPGVATEAIHPVKKCAKGDTGTMIQFWPDLSLFHDEHGHSFSKPQWSLRMIADRFRHKSFVHPGVTFAVVDDREGAKELHEWCSTGGVADLVAEMTADTGTVAPVVSFQGEDGDITVDAAMAWTVEGRDTSIGFANGVATPEGGTHINGFRNAVTESVQKYIADRSMLKDKEAPPNTRDIFAAGLMVASIMLPGPQFAGNSKSKLMNPEATSRTRGIVMPAMSRWLEENPDAAKTITELAIAAMRSRTKSNAEQKAVRELLGKGNKSRSGLPAKLRDCTFKTDRPTELLIVEGESAGGTAIDARDPSFQAILPLRGKPLNSYRESISRVVKSMADLILSMGCGIGDDFDLEKFRYDRIVVLADADDDGLHIRALLLAFLYTWCPGMVESGRLYYALPPLWTTVHQGERVYLEDDAAMREWREANPSHKAHMGRLKGLGEMDADELRSVMGSDRKIGVVNIDNPANLARLAERLFGPKSDLRKTWYLERSGESLKIGGAN